MALLGCCEGVARAADPVPLALGSLAGQVRSSNGVVQMGAAVALYNRYDQLVRQALTGESGTFVFEGLTPDLYSVRVSLASFLPAMRRNISVMPGTRSILTINLASVLSSIELFYVSTGQGPLMSDDWRLTLRSSTATRPVLRILPGWDTHGKSTSKAAALFSDTRGLVRLSTGDAAAPTLGSQPDLGTAFALATSIYGGSRLQVSGNLGYAAESAMPTAGFRTSFARPDSWGPEVSVTMRQLYLPVRAGLRLVTGQGEAPALRTMSASVYDRISPFDGFQLEYGASLDSVVFLDRLNYFSPFARVSYDFGKVLSVQAAWQSGGAPAELLMRSAEGMPDLQTDLNALALVPRVSLRDGHAHVQRSQSFEIGAERVEESRRFTVAAYYETVENLGLSMMSDAGFVDADDVLPELSSRLNVFHAGGFRRYGYMASVSQTLHEHLELTFAGGSSGALAPPADALTSNTGVAVREGLREAQRPWVMARATSSIPGAGTRITASYGWTDFRALMPQHIYMTQRFQHDLGWNLSVRQPVPNVPGVPGRLEVHADARNLLANGYLAVNANGRKAVFLQQPRLLRGGVSFIF
jgi:hypothetical protein